PTRWVASHLTVPAGVQRVLLPGLCAGDLAIVAERAGVPVERGPGDLRDLPEFFGQATARPPDYGDYDIAILAEINHAPRLTHEAILAQARSYHASGADVMTWVAIRTPPGRAWAMRSALYGIRASVYRLIVLMRTKSRRVCAPVPI